MTLQIGLLAKDGILVASDTRVLNNPNKEGAYIELYEHANKIIRSVSEDTVIAWSRNRPSEEFLSSAVEAFDRDWENFTALRERCIQAWKIERTSRPGENIACCLLAATAGSREMYRAEFSDTGAVDVHTFYENLMPRGIITGNEGNSACFLIHRYLPKTSGVSVDNLLPWAAHYILAAGKINPHGVDGLLIYVSRSGGKFKRFSENLRKELESNSERIDALTVEHLFKKVLVAD
jgi:hypothetical protein